MTRQSTRPNAKTVVTKAATAAVLSLLLAAIVTPARAADDDVPLDSKLIRSFLEGIGLRRDGEAINYQERAPLVIPPTRALPPPQSADAAIANNPAWPKDPDVQRAKDEAKRKRTEIRSAGDQILHDESVLSEKELTPGRKTYRPTHNGNGGSASDDSEIGRRLSSSELGYKGGLFSHMFDKDKPDAARFTGEPPRTALTEPPPGYQTPSPDQPYGIGKDATAPKAEDYTTKHFEYDKDQ